MLRAAMDVFLDPSAALGVVAAQMDLGLAGGQLNQVVAKFLCGFASGRAGGDNHVVGRPNFAHPLVVGVAVEQEVEILFQPATEFLGLGGMQPIPWMVQQAKAQLRRKAIRLAFDGLVGSVELGLAGQPYIVSVLVICAGPGGI